MEKLGPESYALIGIYTTLTVILSTLDLGLSQSMNREMARLSIKSSDKKNLVDTAYTLEVIYYLMALVVIATLFLAASYIADDWLNPQNLSRKTVLHSLWIMALLIGLRWPMSIYIGGLNGLQKQILVNKLAVIFITLQNIGALVVLIIIKPTIEVFFGWQVFVATVQLVVYKKSLWLSLPQAHLPAFNKIVIKKLWRFAAGMTGVSLTAVVLLQMDKIILSKMLTLTELGYYMFAVSAAGVLHRIFSPIFTAFSPKLTGHVATSNRLELAITYHQGSKVLSIALFPAALCLTFFASEILIVWTHNEELTKQIRMIFAIVVLGNMVGGIMNMPYALQIAHGWTRLSIISNLMAIAVLLPSLYIAVKLYGSIGAASIWLILNCGYLIFTINIMHSKILHKEKMQWYLNDVGKPFIFTSMAVFISQMIMPVNLNNYATLTWIAFTFIASTLICTHAVGGLNFIKSFQIK